jgi:regulator of RNase E activity RraA
LDEIDTIPEGAVVFISSPSIPNAVYGGLMSTRAKYSGAVGTVIDGRFRDIDEHRDLEFPVCLTNTTEFIAKFTFIRHHSLTKSTKVFARDVGTAPPATVKVVGVNVPVKLNDNDVDMIINPGDYIIADSNGVVVLKREDAGAAIEAVAKKVEADAKVAEELKKGTSFTDACKKFR